MSQFRAFRTPPGQYLVEEFLAHIRQTGQPETFPGLHPGPIAKTEPFLLLRPFEIHRRKRPKGNLAPCPMCQPNKYLRGSLIYLPDLELLLLLVTAVRIKIILLPPPVNIESARCAMSNTTTFSRTFLLSQHSFLSFYKSVPLPVRPR